MICNISFPHATFHHVTQNVLHGLHHIWSKIVHACHRINDAALGALLRNHHWILHPRTYAAKVHMFAIKFFSRNKKTLHSCSHVLPTLPIPDLQSSVDKYVLSLKPFVTEDNFASLQTRSRYFVADEGAQLQAKLIQETQGKRAWFERAWLSAAYLENRFSSMYTAWYGMDALVPTTNKYAMPEVDRAARIVYLILQYREMIRAGTLSPMEGDVPVCMHQFRRVFGANRTPGEACDTLDVHSNSQHIIVLVKGKVFKMELVDSKGKPLSEMGILEGLRMAYHSAISGPEGEGVSVLSLQNRTEWAQEKARIAQNNKENLDVMDTALFAVRLSDKKPADDNELAAGLFLNEKDLYIDKGITLTAFANGKIGGTMEHTMADATIVSRIMEWAYQNEAYPQGYDRGTANDIIPPSQLEWKLSKESLTAIENSKFNAIGMFNQVDMECSVFDGYGKNAIQGHSCNPDSFVQMALQLAYQKLHQHIPFTYESCSTRLFFHGRTETIRSGSVESQLFCSAMENQALSKEDKRSALKNALKAHVKYKREAAAGMGCDRHLLALKRIAGNQRYPFFEKEDFKKEYDLATSQTPTRLAKGGGFGPSSVYGYGISYHIYPNHIRFNISKYRSNKITAKMMYDAISEALKEMKELYE